MCRHAIDRLCRQSLDEAVHLVSRRSEQRREVAAGEAVDAGDEHASPCELQRRSPRALRRRSASTIIWHSSSSVVFGSQPSFALGLRRVADQQVDFGRAVELRD